MEQRYLLTEVASIFPKFINFLTHSAPPKQRDVIFRYYPFVLSKGIYLGFKFLCPGNQKLFKGAFQRILYLSTFRLLTGLDICPGSIDSLRLKLYPDDANEDDQDSNAEEDNGLRPFGNHRETPHLAEPHKTKEQLRQRPSDIDARNDRSKYKSKKQPSQSHRDSVVKFVGDRESLRFRPDKPQSLGHKILPRQHQVQFDTLQISPLLQQCLGKESISVGPKHFIKRTEPVSYCQSGGVETFESKKDGTTSMRDEDLRMEEYKTKARELKMTSMQATIESRRNIKALASEREKILSDRTKIHDFVDTIMARSNKFQEL